MKKLTIQDTEKGDQLITEILELYKQRHNELNPNKIKLLKGKTNKKLKEFYEFYEIINNKKRRF